MSILRKFPKWMALVMVVLVAMLIAGNLMRHVSARNRISEQRQRIQKQQERIATIIDQE